MKKSVGAKTIVYPTPAFAVGTYDKDGKSDVMTAAWGGISSSNPPCISISLQKPRYTYANIMEKKAFTISVPSESQVKEADYFGIISGKVEDKFSVSGLTPVKSELVDAPYVGEFPLVLECKLVHTVELGVHTQFTGEIVDVKVDEEFTDAEGLPDISKIKPFFYDPAGRAYYATGKKLGNAFDIGKAIR